MSTNEKITASEKKKGAMTTSGDETAPSNAGFLGVRVLYGVFLVLQPLLDDEAEPTGEEKPAESDILDQSDGLKNCRKSSPQSTEESHKEGDIFDANNGPGNRPDAPPADEPDGSDEVSETGEQVHRKPLDSSNEDGDEEGEVLYIVIPAFLQRM